MADREKVIEGLQKCAAIHQGFMCESCEYPGDDCAVDDAIALLKAQEPRILGLDEFHRGMAVWLEDVDKEDVVLTIGGSSCGGAKCFITEYDLGVSALDSEYGIRWRAWTAKPTIKMRKAVKWE